MVSLKQPSAIGQARFENEMDNPFFDFFEYLSKRSKEFFLEMYYIVLFEKSAFGNNFGLRDVVELKMLSLIFFEAFRSVFKKVKNGFPIVFSNLARPMAGGYFRDTMRERGLYGCFRVFSPFLPNKNRLGVFSSDLKMDPLNLYPTEIRTKPTKQRKRTVKQLTRYRHNN